MRHSLHFLCEHPTPYHHFLFRSIAADPEIDLTVYFREKLLGSHPWQSDMTSGFRSRYFQRTLGLDWTLLQLAVREKSSFFIIAGWTKPAQIALISMLSAAHRWFALWTDTPSIDSPRSPFKAVPRGIWLKWAFKRAIYIMGTGRPAMAAFSQMGCPEKKQVNFPCFIDVDSFSPKTAIGNADNDQITLLSSGRLINSIKGHDLALMAIAYVRDKIGLKIHHLRYRLAGTGPDLESLRSLASTLGLADQVEFVGWLESNQLPDFYRSGQILIHPSHLEPYGNAVIEAMACGLVVIGSHVTGAVIDRISHGQNGLIHRAGDLENLAAQITFVLAYPEKVAPMGAQARITAEEWPVSRAVSIIKSMLQSTQS